MQIHYTNDLSILNLCVIPLGRILFPGSVQVNKRYIVRLSEGERETLRKIISTGEGPAYKIRHAHILLKADAKGPNWTDEAIADTFSGHPNTVANIRQRLWSTVWKQPWHPGSASIGLAGWMGGVEAQIMALRCSAPPEGRAGWTLRLLADKLVELGVRNCPVHLSQDRATGSKKRTSPPSEGILCGYSGTEG